MAYKKDYGPKANGNIKADPVRVIDSEGNMLGVITLREGIARAEEAGLDLVEMSPNAEPPVCKVMDLGKYLYEQQKKKKEAKKKQKIVHLKEIKLRVNTDPHDLEYRLVNAKKFLEAGDKVKFSLRFRGREMSHADIARDKFIAIIEELEEFGKIDSQPKMEGNQLTMILGPITSA